MSKSVNRPLSGCLAQRLGLRQCVAIQFLHQNGEDALLVHVETGQQRLWHLCHLASERVPHAGPRLRHPLAGGKWMPPCTVTVALPANTCPACSVPMAIAAPGASAGGGGDGCSSPAR